MPGYRLLTPLALCLPLLLGACAQPKAAEAVQPMVGMANPASVFCIQQGGKLEIRKESNGEAGYCHLPDGKVVEEWAYFRSLQKQP
ncbi:DUF333 domain-containing protein [uncultured Aquitalea sp.]|uniref:putative hemolysin n=1 Tax=uncultured Aquitalea sp. TaxID=540272 RepID=UPI0025FF8679|nr:DUF333 domain-containing protein [uncultured Aquitalea sp.]